MILNKHEGFSYWFVIIIMRIKAGKRYDNERAIKILLKFIIFPVYNCALF